VKSAFEKNIETEAWCDWLPKTLIDICVCVCVCVCAQWSAVVLHLWVVCYDSLPLAPV